jgi:sphingolipid C9-methyltransferase
MREQYLAIKNGPLPADAAGSESFSNILLFSLLAIVPWYLARQLGGGIYTTLFLAPFTALPILITFWTVASTISPRKNEKARYPGRPVQDYLHFRSEKDRMKYYGKNRIPMETFHEMYFDEKVDFKGDCLDVMEYRHDWASFRFTLSLFKFFFTGMIPEVIMHTRSQGLSITICAGMTTLTSWVQTKSKSATITTAVTTFTVGFLALA